MKRLKCIGGAHDGRYFNVEDGCRVGDQVRVGTMPLPLVAAPFGDEIPPDYLVELGEYAIYTIRRVYFSVTKDVISALEYLAPPDMSDEDAVRHQFAKGDIA
jgi:hypothetical protein